MKANCHRREVILEVGDMVLVHLQPYRQSSVSQGRHHKLCKLFYGPFPVLERVQVAYCVGLPAGSHIHPVFHIYVLKLFRGQLV
uniref:Tf2-1-like SH3-like domain-containing protein n=1 Tax=Cajanus cajan TaxID=3821 RepID=A0A151UHD2_CAJCA